MVRRSFRFTKMGKAWLLHVYVPSETRRRGQVVLWLCKTSSSLTTLQNIEVIKTLTCIALLIVKVPQQLRFCKYTCESLRDFQNAFDIISFSLPCLSNGQPSLISCKHQIT